LSNQSSKGGLRVPLAGLGVLAKKASEFPEAELGGTFSSVFGDFMQGENVKYPEVESNRASMASESVRSGII
jgi:hypothetical protein